MAIPTYRLNGKIVIVTGAASGIGRAIVERFGAEGAHVVINDINQAGAESVAQSITAAGGTAGVSAGAPHSRSGNLLTKRATRRNCCRRCKTVRPHCCRIPRLRTRRPGRRRAITKAL